MRQSFKPEFINRLDDIVVFSPLSTDDLGQIVSLQIDRLERRRHRGSAGLRRDALGRHAPTLGVRRSAVTTPVPR